MISYLKSENYRLMRKKTLHITSLIFCSLIIAAAFALDFFGKNEIGFPFATSSFFYSNVIGGGVLLFIIALLVNGALTGKDLSLLKQSVSFGISRNTIFWSKLILTLGYFLLLCFIGMLLMVGLGETLFPTDVQALRNFLLASTNMFPLVVSGFFLIHVLKMSRISDVYTVIIVLIVYTMSDRIVNLIFRRIEGFNQLHKWTPSSLLNENILQYMENTVAFDWKLWIVGLAISLIVLPLGIKVFQRQNID